MLNPLSILSSKWSLGQVERDRGEPVQVLADSRSRALMYASYTWDGVWPGSQATCWA